MCILAVALGWLCWRLLEQDRQLESQRAQERLEQAAEHTAGALESSLHELDEWLPAADARTDPPPAGVAQLVESEHGVNVRPAGLLLYLPPASPAAESPDRVFALGERIEFQARDPAGAAERFRALAASSRPEVRAGALLRLARNLRKMGRYGEALAAYGELEQLRHVAIEGVPVDLTALDARCGVSDAMGRRAELKREALLMDAGLRSCRWQLAGPAWDFHRAEVRRWASPPALTAREREALSVSRAAEWLCQLWPHPIEPNGRRILIVENGPVLVSRSAGADRLAAILVSPARSSPSGNRRRPGRGPAPRWCTPTEPCGWVPWTRTASGRCAVQPRRAWPPLWC